MKSLRSILFLALASALPFGASSVLASPVAGGGGGASPVVYSPTAQVIQGTDPFTQSYTLSVTSPSNLTGSVSVPFTTTVLTVPSGVADATALGFISLNPSTLTFTAPNQVQSTVVTLTYPLGNFPGNYSYQISTVSASWGVSVTDPGATVNAVVAPSVSPTTGNPPTVAITSPVNNATYYYYPVSNTPASVPIQIVSSVQSTDPVISALNASVNGTDLATSLLDLLGLNSASASGSYTFTTTTPGTYVVGASATNSVGTVTTSTEFTVAIGAPPPTVTVSSPAINTNFTYTLGGTATGATVPVSFTGVSAYGDITALSATLDGTAIAGITTTGVGSALTATGAVSLSTVASGSHSLVFTATNAYGTATSTVPFTVTSVAPLPTIAIGTPANGAKFSFEAGGSVSVPYTISGAVASGTITSLKATFGSTALTPTITGLNTASVTATGAIAISAAGTYTISATDSNAAGSASASTTFTVTQSASPISGTLYWLPPISCGQSLCGGSLLPISFDILQSNGQGCRGTTSYVTNTSVVIAIIEDFSNGTSSIVSLDSYSSSSSTSPSYTIVSNWGQPYYLTNFATATGVHHYHIEAYLPLGGSSVQVLGQTDVYTTASCAYSDCRNSSSCYSGSACAAGTRWNGWSCGQSSGCRDNGGWTSCGNCWNNGYCSGGSNWYSDCWGNYCYWGSTRCADQGCDDSTGYTGCNGWGY